MTSKSWFSNHEVLTTDDAQVEACPWFYKFLTYKMPIYSVWCPHHHFSRLLHSIPFGEGNWMVGNSTACTPTYLPSLYWHPHCCGRNKDFGIKKPIKLKHAMIQSEILYFLHGFYRLFLLESPPHPDNPHCQNIWPNHACVVFSLRSYPRYYRSHDILLAYSTSFREAQNHKS